MATQLCITPQEWSSACSKTARKKCKNSFSFISKFVQGTALNKRPGHAGLLLAFLGLPHSPPILLKQPRHKAVEKSCSRISAGVPSKARQNCWYLHLCRLFRTEDLGQPGFCQHCFCFADTHGGNITRAHGWYPKAEVYSNLLFLSFYINCGQVTLCLCGWDPYCTPKWNILGSFVYKFKITLQRVLDEHNVIP